MRKYLTSSAFWENYSPDAGKVLAEGGKQAFDRGLKFYLILNTVGNLEHSFKIILHHLNPDTKRISQFCSVCKTLFRKENPYLKNIPVDWMPPFELIRLLRNCHHTSWVYVPNVATEISKKIVFQNREYIFRVKHKVDFVSWNLLTNLMLDILRIIKALISDPNVVEIEYIEDWGAGDSV